MFQQEADRLHRAAGLCRRVELCRQEAEMFRQEADRLHRAVVLCRQEELCRREAGMSRQEAEPAHRAAELCRREGRKSSRREAAPFRHQDGSRREHPRRGLLQRRARQCR